MYDYSKPHYTPVAKKWSGLRLEAVVTSCEVTFRRDGASVYASDGGSREGEYFSDLDEAAECFSQECAVGARATSLHECARLVSISVLEVEYQDGEILGETDACVRNESRVFAVGPHGALELAGECWPASEFEAAVQAFEAAHAPRCFVPASFGPAAGQYTAAELPGAVIMRPDVWAALLAYCDGEGIFTRDVAANAELSARRQFVAETIYTLGEGLDFGEILADAEA